MPHVLSIIGARPQFIKAAPVSRALAARGVSEFVVHTGQHYDRAMSAVFFDELGIRDPDVNLGVGSGSHGAQTAAMLVGLERVIGEQDPRWVLIYGDTNSTVAGALAAAKLHVPVAHVEAGLRSFNRRMPEEINRVVADALATLLFVPTDTARAHLLQEGVPAERILQTGDVMYDAALMHGQDAKRHPGAFERLKLDGEPFVLATIHRAENTDNSARLEAILGGLARVAESLRVILPLHPRTRARLSMLPDLPGLQTGKVEIVEPVGFLDMVRLEMNAAVIATDSGGVQKEAFFHRVPCVTLRDETEWVELVDLGWNRLAPPASAETVASSILSARGTQGADASPYGRGDAAGKIANALAATTKLEAGSSEIGGKSQV